jgi:hypothetical protein
MNIALPKPLANIRPYMVTAILLAVYLAVVYFWNGQNIMEFIIPTPTQGDGYDGQFTFYIARDPLGAVSLMDGVPAYRYQRVLHAVLTRILSVGQAPLMPYVMLLIGYAVVVLSVIALEELLAAQGVNPWYALAYAGFGGVFASVRANTTEPLAYGLVIFSLLAWQRNRFGWHVAFFALAALAKEPTLFFPAGFILYYFLTGERRKAVIMAVAVAAPFAAYQIFLRLWLGAWGAGGTNGTSFQLIPFGAILDILRETNFLGLVYWLVLGVVAPTLFGILASGIDLFRRKWHPYAFCTLANALMIAATPFTTLREPFGIARLIVGLFISLLLFNALRATRDGIRRPLAYMPIWLVWTLVLVG